MPRRRLLTEKQRADFLALPTDDLALAQHYTLNNEDKAVIVRRRRPQNRLGFALQLCALRYPGRILEPGEIIPEDVLRFIGGQIGLDPVDAERYSERRMTRYNHPTTLAETFGFKHVTQPTRVDLIDWLIPVAKSTRNSGTLVRILIEEMRRRDIAIPGIGARKLEQYGPDVLAMVRGR